MLLSTDLKTQGFSIWGLAQLTTLAKLVLDLIVGAHN